MGDDFPESVPNLSVLVFLRTGETWGGVAGQVHDASRKIKCADQNEEMNQKIIKVMSNMGRRKKRLLLKFAEMLSTSNVSSELRHEHEDWFEDVPQKVQT